MLLLKRRDGIYFETEGAFPQAGSVKDLYKQHSRILQGERNVLEFEMAIFLNYIYVYGYLCFLDNAEVLRPRWG